MITRSSVELAKSYMLTGYGNLEQQKLMLDLIDYENPEKRIPFRHYYIDIIKFIYKYFEAVGFKPVNNSYWQFIQDRMLNYFNKDSHCIIKGNIVIKNISGPFYLDINPSFLKSQIDACKQDNVLILISVQDYTYCGNDEYFNHSNLFVINKKTGAFLVDPNYGSGGVNPAYIPTYKSLMDFLGYTFDTNYYPHCDVSEHGGMCTLVSILSYFFPVLDYKLIKEKLMEYLDYEIKNIKRGVLSFGKRKKNNHDSDIKYLLSLNG